MTIHWMEALLLLGALVFALWIGVGLWNKTIGTYVPALAV